MRLSILASASALRSISADLDSSARMVIYGEFCGQLHVAGARLGCASTLRSASALQRGVSSSVVTGPAVGK